MDFNTWLDTFLEEKEFDLEAFFEIETDFALNLIPVGVVIEHLKIAPPEEQTAIQHILIRLDFFNQSILDFFKHLAKAIAI